MASVYSTLIVSFVTSGGPGTTGALTPPAGFLWVIKDISVTAPQDFYTGLNGINVVDDVGTVFFTVPPTIAKAYASYQWYGSQVIEEARSFSVNWIEDGWGVRISGYKLSLP